MMLKAGGEFEDIMLSALVYDSECCQFLLRKPSFADEVLNS